MTFFGKTFVTFSSVLNCAPACRINYWQNPAGYLNLRPQLHGPYDFVVADFRFCDAQAEIEILAKTLKGHATGCC